jgi:MFS family permease
LRLSFTTENLLTFQRRPIAVLAGFSGNRDLSTLSISVVLQGLGQGIVIPLLLNMILGTVSDNETGMASGIFTTMQAAGSSVGLKTAEHVAAKSDGTGLCRCLAGHHSKR